MPNVAIVQNLEIRIVRIGEKSNEFCPAEVRVQHVCVDVFFDRTGNRVKSKDVVDGNNTDDEEREFCGESLPERWVKCLCCHIA